MLQTRFSSVEEKELPDICSRSCGKPIILEGKLSTDNWKYRLLTDGLLTKLQLLLRWCHIESRKHLVIFSRCIILSHPERYHDSAPNWKPGLQCPSHSSSCASVTGGILLSSLPPEQAQPGAAVWVAVEHCGVPVLPAEHEAALRAMEGGKWDGG